MRPLPPAWSVLFQHFRQMTFKYLYSDVWFLDWDRVGEVSLYTARTQPSPVLLDLQRNHGRSTATDLAPVSDVTRRPPWPFPRPPPAARQCAATRASAADDPRVLGTQEQQMTPVGDFHGDRSNVPRKWGASRSPLPAPSGAHLPGFPSSLCGTRDSISSCAGQWAPLAVSVCSRSASAAPAAAVPLPVFTGLSHVLPCRGPGQVSPPFFYWIFFLSLLCKRLYIFWTQITHLNVIDLPFFSSPLDLFVISFAEEKFLNLI